MNTSPTQRRRNKRDALRIMLGVCAATVLASVLATARPQLGLLSWGLIPLGVYLACLGRRGSLALGVQRLGVGAVGVGLGVSVVLGAAISNGVEALGDLDAWGRHLFATERATIPAIFIALGCLYLAWLATGGERRRKRRPTAATADADDVELVASSEDGFRVTRAGGWLRLDGAGRIPETMVLGCAEPWSGEGEFGHLSSELLADDPAKPVWDGHVNYGVWGGVELAPLSDHPTRVAMRQVLGEADGLVEGGRVTVQDPGDAGRAALVAAMLELARGLARPTEAHLATLLKIAGSDPAPGWRRVALYSLLEDPRLEGAPERDGAIELGRANEGPRLRLLAEVAARGPAAATELAARAAADDLPAGLLDRVAATWPPDAMITVYRALARSRRGVERAVKGLRALPHEHALDGLLSLLHAPDADAFAPAARAAASLDGDATTAALLARWPTPHQPRVLAALGACGTPAAADALAAIAAGGARAADAAAVALAATGDPRANAALLGALDRTAAGDVVSYDVLAALGRVGGVEAATRLVALSAGGLPDYQRPAARDAIEAIQARLAGREGALAVVDAAGGQLSVTGPVADGARSETPDTP